jgi:hypothetical protein
MKNSKTDKAAKDRKILAAFAAHFTGPATLTLNGTSYAPKDLEGIFQAHLVAMAAEDALRAQLQTAVLAAKAKGAVVKGILSPLRQHLISQYGGSSQIVADFGFTPKPRKTTVAAKAHGIVAAQATRKAGGKKAAKQDAHPAATPAATVNGASHTAPS